MRVLVATFGSRGDVEPMAGLAVRLRELGADVRVCAPPEKDFEALLGRVGLPSVPLGKSMRAMKPPKSAEESSQRVAEFIATQYETLVAQAGDRDAIVATGFTHFAARSVADKLGIFYAPATFCPLNLPSPHHTPLSVSGKPFPEDADDRTRWELESRYRNELWGPSINAHRAAAGLPPVDDVTEHMFSQRPWLASDPVLGPWHEPADLDVVTTGAWTLPDDRPLPEDLEAFLEAGEPPVYVGLGSMRVAKDVAGVAIEAVRARGRRALVSRGWAELGLVDDRDDCFAVGEANHQALFGRVAAVVHHGGAGTTTTAARAGAPQVVVPQAADQPYWASRVAALGIGAAHDGSTPTARSLSAALGAALTPGTRERAATVAAEVRTDGAEAAAKLLLDAAGR